MYPRFVLIISALLISLRWCFFFLCKRFSPRIGHFFIFVPMSTSCDIRKTLDLARQLRREDCGFHLQSFTYNLHALVHHTAMIAEFKVIRGA